MSESRSKDPEGHPARIAGAVRRAWDEAFEASSPAPPSPKRPALGVISASQSPTIAPKEFNSLEQISPAPPPSSSARSVQASSLLVLDSHAISASLPSSPRVPPPVEGKKFTWSRFPTALRELHKSTGLFPPLHSAVSDLVSCVEGMNLHTERKTEYELLELELARLSESLDRHLRASNSATMTECIVKMAQSIQEKVDLIANKQRLQRNKGRRLVDAMDDDNEIMECYRRIQALFQQLQIDAELSIWGIANEQLANTRLNGLTAVKLAVYDSSLSTEINRRMCTAHTRTDVLSELETWSDNPSAPKVYWMNGMAGTGKTTIACTFADWLKKRKRLAASFFCTRTTAECQDVARIVPTIAYQLARYSIPFQSALCRVIGSDPDLGSCTVSTQFERLLKGPLLEVRDAIPEGLVVVIDALDECTAKKGVELMLNALFQASADLPLRFFVTSRPEPNVRKKIQDRPSTSRTVLILHDIEQSLVQADIELYLKEELAFVTPVQAKQLAKLAGRLFIYAATAVRYIQMGEVSGNLEGRLQSMLSISSHSENKHTEIDQLYKSILLEAIEDNALEQYERKSMRIVLWTVVCAREAIGIETLAGLTGMHDRGKILAILQPLRSVLHVSDKSNTVATLHASFQDFILDKNRSFALSCDAKQHSQLLTEGCFELMKNQLRFNICALESSYVADKEAFNLEERTGETVSPDLAYACRYWGDHLRQAAGSKRLCVLIQSFLSDRLLFWMEVMNLKHWMGIGARVIRVAKLWLMTGGGSPELLRFAEDAQKFVATFAASAVCQSTPHLYISALPLCHRSSAVFEHYSRRARGLVNLKGTGIQRRDALVLGSWKLTSGVSSVVCSSDDAYLAIGCFDGSIVIKDSYDGTFVGTPFEGHAGNVTSVAFSPDSFYIASGSHDTTVRVWDIQDGTLVGTPFKGHTIYVTAVAFSPDNLRVISGSDDTTVRVWDIQDGASVGAPLGSHTRAVRSVAFSPDGSRIVSGSDDRTICVYNIQDGSPIGTSYRISDHAHRVTSIAFSLDSSFIVSGSEDKTIRVWNIKTRTQVCAPLEGHTHGVTSVAFSPDGSRVVSGSDDKTIRLWNIRSGSLVGAPLVGHDDSVTSVAFSPDGSRIISGSRDKTVRSWGIQDNIPIGAPSEGHTRCVTSVGFSPDGSRIVSGSYDESIRVWNMHDATLVGTPLLGHTGFVRSVAFSPEGSRIVSGSGDKTICVWNIRNSSLIGAPFKLKGHTGAVRSVAFSPDGLRIVSGSDDKTIRIWDPEGGDLVAAPSRGHTGHVRSVAFSPDCSRVVSGSDDKTVRVWNSQDGTPASAPFDGHSGFVTSAVFSTDGLYIISGSNDKTIRMWNAQDGTLIITPLEGHTSSITSVAFSPDGLHIASGSDDKTVRIWNVRDGTLANTPFEGHTSSITSVAFSPDGSRIVSGSDDKTVRVWSMQWQNHNRISAHFEGYASSATSMAPLLGDSHTAPGPSDGAVPMPSTHNGTLATDDCTISEDGWMMQGSESQLLSWVPPDLTHYLSPPNNLWVAGPQGVVYLDYSDVLPGDNWGECYSQSLE